MLELLFISRRSTEVHLVDVALTLIVCRGQSFTEGATEQRRADGIYELRHRGKLAAWSHVTHQEEWKLIVCLNWQVHDEKVSLRVNAEFLHSYGGEPLDVDFCYNRWGGRNQ